MATEKLAWISPPSRAARKERRAGGAQRNPPFLPSPQRRVPRRFTRPTRLCVPLYSDAKIAIIVCNNLPIINLSQKLGAIRVRYATRRSATQATWAAVAQRRVRQSRGTEAGVPQQGDARRRDVSRR